MKILHTADWHIGKVLHKHSLAEELNLFFDWMINLIEEEDIDLLLVSGDIFDMANPTIKDKEQYYQIMMRLYHSGCKVIITGGNHDSVGELNAPKEVLSAINITVVGGATTDLNKELIPIRDAQGKLKMVVAAVPFLRDRDLRNKEDNNKYDSRVAEIRAGIKDHYAKLAELCEEKYKEVPAFAMGHLYASGATSSDSEREIHVGNQAAVESTIFPSRFNYVALGHIHRPQMVDSNPSIQYSGSPIALSFSEKDDDKKILIIETLEGKVTEVRSVAVPKSRELRKFTGSFTEVEAELKEYKPDFPLSSFVELEITENDFSAVILAKVEELIVTLSSEENYRVLKHKTIFENKRLDTADLFTAGTSIEELKPVEVFQRRLDQEEMDEESKKKVEEAFIELLEGL